MRPLPQLDDLPQQPSVFDQQTDDFNTALANEFSGMGAQQTAADGETAAVYTSMDPISASIDALSTALNAAGSVFDLLSGELDAVNLDPQIENFQALDGQLDSGLSSFTIDTGSIATGLLSDIAGLFTSLAQALVASFQDALNVLYYLLQDALAQIGQLWISVFG